jgi:hypothetical protein
LVLNMVLQAVYFHTISWTCTFLVKWSEGDR